MSVFGHRVDRRFMGNQQIIRKNLLTEVLQFTLFFGVINFLSTVYYLKNVKMVLTCCVVQFFIRASSLVLDVY